jgi:hypothetical protein
MSKYEKEEKVWAEGNKLEGEGRNEKRERKGEKEKTNLKPHKTWK